MTTRRESAQPCVGSRSSVPTWAYSGSLNAGEAAMSVQREHYMHRADIPSELGLCAFGVRHRD